ncbi:MAG: tRNA (pseudouridine(54)-N(1))-methyltransferase TrmY [Candidatus Bipolaricaulota bacterium]
MRTFVVVSHTAPLSGEFSLSDLPGGAGRLDVLCRAATDAFLVSHGIRKDVALHFVVRDRLTISLWGPRLRRLNPDERSTGALLREALRTARDLPPGEERGSTPGITVRWLSLAGLLDEMRAAGTEPMLLDEGGEPLRTARLPERPGFILSDHQDFAPAEASLLADLPRVSVGPTVLQGHQCIVLVHNELDLREARISWEVLTTVIGEPRAQLVAGFLSGEGIPVRFRSQVPASVYPVTVDGLAEVQVLVPAPDLPRARETLAAFEAGADREGRDVP